MKREYEVIKYLKGKYPKYILRIGSLELYFRTIKEAEEYYQEYLK